MEEAPKSGDDMNEEAPKSRDDRSEEAPKAQEHKNEEAPRSRNDRSERAPKARDDRNKVAPKAHNNRNERAPKARDDRNEEAPNSRDDKKEEAPETRDAQQVWTQQGCCTSNVAFARTAWEAAFDPQVNAAGSRATGLAPFTRRIEKNLLAEVRDRAVAGDLLVHPSVQEHPESLVSAMFPAQPVGDSLAQAEGSSIRLNRGPVTETVVYDKIKEIVVAREQKEQARHDRKRKREEVSYAKREQALQENSRVLSLLQQGTRLSQLSCKQLSALLIACGLQCAKTKPGLLEQVQGLQLEGSVDSVSLPQSISAVSDSHSDSGSESSVVSAGQQSDGEHSDSEQSEELFFPAKIVDSCTRGKSFCYRVRWAGYGPAHDTWENLAIDH